MTRSQTKKKLAELTSILGVGVIGFGLGALLSIYFQPFSLLIILIGIALHGVAMYNKSKTETKELLWVRLFYWLCWLILAGLTIFILVGLI